MATILTHASAAAAMCVAYGEKPRPRRFWDIAIVVSMLPDADVLAFVAGIDYAAFLGHRGFTHSLAFAALTGVAVAWLGFPESRGDRRGFWKLAGFFAVATASHGLLDMLTDGGEGVAIFSPFQLKRYFFPWSPIFVSPIGLRDFLSPYGYVVFLSELKFVWLPVWSATLAVVALRRLIRL